MHKPIQITLLTLFIFFSSLVHAATIYVDAGASGTNVGSSWANAHTALQNAINASSAGDEIWVAAGTYKPTLRSNTGTAGATTAERRDQSFYLNKNIGIYGGFAGTETLLSQRNRSSNPVILSGDIDISGNNDCYHVFITNGLSSAAVLDGVTIAGGKADGSGSGVTPQRNIGGGMCNIGSILTLTNVIVTGNTAIEGGGMFNFNGSSSTKHGPTLTNVIISGNTATSGGGMYNYSSSPTLMNVTVSGNAASTNGGGMFNELYQQSSYPFQPSRPIVTNTIFCGNTKGGSATIVGADIYNMSCSNCSNWQETLTYISYSQLQGHQYEYDWANGFQSSNIIFRGYSHVSLSDPDGVDNVWMTADDGLNIYDNIPASGAGIATGYRGNAYGGGTATGYGGTWSSGIRQNFAAPSTDITGATRGSTPSMGAYEGSFITRLYVDAGATGTNAGSSWTNAYTDLQDAINGSSAGDSIWIAAGTYKPNLDTYRYTGIYVGFLGAGTTSRDAAFALDKDIKIYGGFSGTETILSQRNSASNAVILSGDIGTVGSNSDNCYHVFITYGLSSAAVLDGVTITGGKAEYNLGDMSFSGGVDVYYRSDGGGMYNYNSSPTLTNITISGNTAEYGGGMLNDGSSPTLTNVTISGNAAIEGGGMYNDGSSPSLTNVTISDNTASTTGGGMCNSYSFSNISSSPTIVNTIFWGNKKGTSSTIAGADICNNSSTATITYSLVQLASSSYTSGNNNLLTTNTNMVYATDPSFVNASDPDGADNVWMTGDDGLVLSSTSPGIGAGTSSSAPSYDITNKVRPTTPSIGAYEGKICKLSNNLPTVPATYTSSFASADGSYTCYCDDNQNLILALDLNSTGAVVPTTGVSLEIGATTTTSWSTAGGIITNANGGAIINRKWDVAPTTQPTSDVTVIYPFTHTEYSAAATALGVLGTTITNVNQLEMYKLTSAGTFADPHASGAAGVGLAHGASASTSNWVWSQHGNGTDHLATYKVASFSGGGGGGGASSSPLPVELIHFDAQPAANHTADLHWATASETNNSHFGIERSYDGRTFETVGNVAGNGTTSHLIDYNYTDETIAKSQNTAYYRLKQVDYDGAYEYSDVRVVRFDKRADRLEIAAYPNPFNQEVTIHVNANEPYAIQVTDINGVVVLSVDHTESRTHRLDVSEYTAGVYIIEVTSTQGTQHLKVIKQ